eukprot:TRINITY_DN4273_c3_g1_i1.p1 TRINITY_DN4273_c3_g1~~TRINITY_DN4273_c3_g1_i1.p1  ORF type:complete len:291 (+),score=53.76 TRINITY_DN4273_c3_g1_i1:77-949(+)
MSESSLRPFPDQSSQVSAGIDSLRVPILWDDNRPTKYLKKAEQSQPPHLWQGWDHVQPGPCWGQTECVCFWADADAAEDAQVDEWNLAITAVGKFWKVGTYQKHSVFLNEPPDDTGRQLLYYSNDCWFVYKTGSQEYIMRGVVPVVHHSSVLCEAAWYVNGFTEPARYVTCYSGMNDLAQENMQLKNELERLRQLAAPATIHQHSSSFSSGMTPRQQREVRFPNQNDGVKMGWRNKAVALMAAHEMGDRKRVDDLLQLFSSKLPRDTREQLDKHKYNLEKYGNDPSYNYI